MYIHPVQIIILLSVALTLALGSIVYARRREQRRLAVPGAAADEKQQIKERPQVLERIATEKENSLSREIEELRDR